MSLREAAEQIPDGMGEKALRAAITQPVGTKYPPLKAKHGPRGMYVILADALRDWLDQLPDA